MPRSTSISSDDVSAGEQRVRRSSRLAARSAPLSETNAHQGTEQRQGFTPLGCFQPSVRPVGLFGPPDPLTGLPGDSISMLLDQAEESISFLRQAIVARRAICTVYITGVVKDTSHGQLAREATYRYLYLNRGDLQTDELHLVNTLHRILPMNEMTFSELLALHEQENETEPSLLQCEDVSGSSGSRTPSPPRLEPTQGRQDTAQRRMVISAQSGYASRLPFLQGSSASLHSVLPSIMSDPVSAPSAADRMIWARANLGGSLGLGSTSSAARPPLAGRVRTGPAPDLTGYSSDSSEGENDLPLAQPSSSTLSQDLRHLDLSEPLSQMSYAYTESALLVRSGDGAGPY